MLQVGYHNDARFYPLDFGFHTSANQANDRLSELDKRCCGKKPWFAFLCKETGLDLAQILTIIHVVGR